MNLLTSVITYLIIKHSVSKASQFTTTDAHPVDRTGNNLQPFTSPSIDSPRVKDVQSGFRIVDKCIEDICANESPPIQEKNDALFCRRSCSDRSQYIGSLFYSFFDPSRARVEGFSFFFFPGTVVLFLSS